MSGTEINSFLSGSPLQKTSSSEIDQKRSLTDSPIHSKSFIDGQADTDKYNNWSSRSLTSVDGNSSFFVSPGQQQPTPPSKSLVTDMPAIQ